VDITRQVEGYTTAVDGPLIVQLWHRITSVEGVDCLSAAIANQLRVHKGVYVLHVTMTTKAPDAKARERINQLTERYAHRTRASALVFEGGGFGAATVRAVVAGISMITPHPFPYRVFAYVNTAVEWFSTLPKEPGCDEAYAAALGEIARLRTIHATKYTSLRPDTARTSSRAAR
jgi:hypothetical protein